MVTVAQAFKFQNNNLTQACLSDIFSIRSDVERQLSTP